MGLAFVFLLYSLAVWRLTHMLVIEGGPWLIFSRLRDLVKPTWFGDLFDCFYCMSVWVAVPAALLAIGDWYDRCLWWLALSAAACLLERMTSGERRILAPPTGEIHD